MQLGVQRVMALDATEEICLLYCKDQRTWTVHGTINEDVLIQQHETMDQHQDFQPFPEEF